MAFHAWAAKAFEVFAAVAANSASVAGSPSRPMSRTSAPAAPATAWRDDPAGTGDQFWASKMKSAAADFACAAGVFATSTVKRSVWLVGLPAAVNVGSPLDQPKCVAEKLDNVPLKIVDVA